MDRFKVVGVHSLYADTSIILYYDTVTKVMYQFVGDRRTDGGLCPLYNADGSLMLYEG